MARKALKTKIVAFKVEETLADFLDKLPNKSDFIRKAIVAQLGMACPLCEGSGIVTRGIHDHYQPIIAANNTRPCEECQQPVVFPRNVEGLTEDERTRVEQFLNGGPLYCVDCFDKMPSCDTCNWHLPLEDHVEHHRQLHSH